ncbi:MAG: CPBP family intramembrane metalloprotease [Cellulosilyticum sp.]|nr:CPBP family intramembrane metalloprotease [Cellulosilyticum sp.]
MIHKQGIREIKIYLFGTMLQMALICCLVAILKTANIQYPDVLNLLFIAIGGTSSALWGMIVSKKSGHILSYKQVLKDFFSLKASIRLYLLVLGFLFVIFGKQIILGKVQSNVHWHTFVLAFITAIIFGGIEEIGWRYTFQPLLEKKFPFEIASLMTFLAWGIWHYMYFYIVDGFEGLVHSTFLIGLLGSCFIMGAIYKVSQNLWLCVMYHCLLNVFSQTLIPNQISEVIIYNGIAILVAIVMVRNESVCKFFEVNQAV